MGLFVGIGVPDSCDVCGKVINISPMILVSILLGHVQFAHYANVAGVRRHVHVVGVHQFIGF